MTEIVCVRRAHLRSLHRTFQAIAGERCYFVRPSAPRPGVLKRDIREALRRGLPFYVAVEGEAAVGWIRIAFPEMEALAHCGTLTMGIRRSHRRRGIGARLLRTALARAFEDPERHRVQLEVLDDNAAAIALYSSHGFRVEGTAEKAIRLNGALRNIVHMALIR